jgi:hypothetical protein
MIGVDKLVLMICHFFLVSRPYPLYEVEWKTPHHNIFVDFLNNLKLDFEHNKIKVMLGEKQKIINKHMSVEV